MSTPGLSPAVGAVRGVALAGPVVVLLADRAGDHGLGGWLLIVGAAAVAGSARCLARRPSSGWAPLLGFVLIEVALVLLAVTPLGTITLAIAAVVGTGLALLVPPGGAGPGQRPFVLLGSVGSIGLVAATSAIAGRVAGLQVAAAVAVVVAPIVWRRPSPEQAGRWGTAVVAGATVLALGLVAWVGANDPTVQWFGRVYTHGPRSADQVALTFDDGPDATWSPQVAEILDAHRVEGTFFEVGKAVDARPGVARALHADGHLLANHSYHHDYWRWLDPRYPELDRTQRALRRQVGVCPALFRPPHGQRTPFMLHHVGTAGLHTVTWDVSAEDWSDTNGRRVARRIVEQARPGSIILLHDGLDGTADADRSVLLTALPLILDGLEAKGLHPVRLDELLGVPGYLDPNDC